MWVALVMVSLYCNKTQRHTTTQKTTWPHIPQCWGRRNRQILGTCWPASPAKTRGAPDSVKDCVFPNGAGHYRAGYLTSSLASVHESAGMHTHTHKHTLTHTHTITYTLCTCTPETKQVSFLKPWLGKAPSSSKIKNGKQRRGRNAWSRCKRSEKGSKAVPVL